MDMPPSRYKVVEQGRRLIVVDTHSGTPVTGPDPGQRARVDRLERGRAARDARRGGLTRSAPKPSPIAADDSKILTTQAWFDDKAPRPIRIDRNHQTGFLAALGLLFVAAVAAYLALGWFAFVIAFFFVANKSVWRGVRTTITRWLDRMEQA